MDWLDKLLEGATESNIYRLNARMKAETIARRVREQGAFSSVLDGNEIHDKQTFLQNFAAALNFPAYFGHNWDAFEECLSDLEWLPAHAYVLVYDNAAVFARAQPAEWRTALAILQDAARFWCLEGRPFTVLLRKSGGHARSLPVIA
jgi:RNAse (barnase) inhibitor barstar